MAMDNRSRDDDAMTDRIHRCLDGELARSELTDRERRELDELEAITRESLAFVREAPVPDASRAVLKRIREIEAGAASAPRPRRSVPSLLADVLAWLWRPRPVRIRPAWAVVGLLVLALGGGLFPPGTGQPELTGPDLVPPGPREAVVYVRFELQASQATSVRLAGTFTDWQPSYELTQTAPGRWTGLVPLRPGVHEYAFVVDGENWVPDPDAPAVRDGFGGVNSRIALVPPRPELGAGSS